MNSQEILSPQSQNHQTSLPLDGITQDTAFQVLSLLPSYDEQNSSDIETCIQAGEQAILEIEHAMRNGGVYPLYGDHAITKIYYEDTIRNSQH